MAHIIPMSQPATFGFQKGIVFGGTHLGYETLFEGDDEQRQHQLGQFQEAVHTLATTSDPYEQRTRRLADASFVRDTAGAPPDFAFRREGEESIVELLMQPERAATFAEWHRNHFLALTEAIQDSRLVLRERVAQQVGRLIAMQFLPVSAEAEFNRVARTIRLAAIDSFDGGSVLAKYERDRVALSHMFDDGFRIGKPMAQFFHVGLHEYGHAVCDEAGTDMQENPLLEHTLIEHCISVLAAEPNADPEDLMVATDAGFYRNERKLFAVAMGDNARRIGVPSMMRMLAERDSQTLRAVQHQVGSGFAKLFPEYGDNALNVFTEGYNRAGPLRRHEYAAKWAGQALERAA